jgi:hypothetical protein
VSAQVNLWISLDNSVELCVRLDRDRPDFRLFLGRRAPRSQSVDENIDEPQQAFLPAMRPRELTCQGSYWHLHTQFKLLGNDEDPEPFPSHVVAGKR